MHQKEERDLSVLFRGSLISLLILCNFFPGILCVLLCNVYYCCQNYYKDEERLNGLERDADDDDDEQEEGVQIQNEAQAQNRTCQEKRPKRM